MVMYEVIREYLRDPETVADEMWEGDEVLWIDWREYDEDIISYVNQRLGDDIVEVEFVDNSKEYGDDIVLVRKGEKMQIPYGDVMDRDVTVRSLNKFLEDDYEIRWFMESLGDDTLGFVVLKAQEWRSLEEEFGEIFVDHYLSRISESTRMFDLDFYESVDYGELRKSNREVAQDILQEVTRLRMELKRLKRRRMQGEIDLVTYVEKEGELEHRLNFLCAQHHILTVENKE